MYAIGVDIGASKIAAALVRNGRVLRLQKTEFKARSGSSIKQTVLRVLDSVCGSTRIFGVGVGVPCIFDADGRPFSCPNIRGLNPPELSRAIAKQYRVRVFMENDVKAAAMAELKYGAGRKSKNFVFVALGTGIGGAIIADGKIYKGGLGWAGEFGHMIVKFQVPSPSPTPELPPTLKLWRTGRRAGKFKVPIEWEEIGTKKFLESRKTLKDVNDFAESVALGFVNIAYVLAPECIVVGGGLSSLLDKRFFKKIHASMNRLLAAKKIAPPRVVVSSLGNNAGVLGAALLAYTRGDRKE